MLRKNNIIEQYYYYPIRVQKTQNAEIMKFSIAFESYDVSYMQLGIFVLWI